jgi:hypothetical protein
MFPASSEKDKLAPDQTISLPSHADSREILDKLVGRVIHGRSIDLPFDTPLTVSRQAVQRMPLHMPCQAQERVIRSAKYQSDGRYIMGLSVSFWDHTDRIEQRR